MAEAIIVRQSDLQKGNPTPEQAEELDRRNVEIGEGKRKDEELFDPEPEKKPEEKKAGEKPEEKAEEKPEEKTGELSDAQLLEADEGTLSDEQKTRKSDLSKAKEAADKEEEDKKILEAKEEDLDDAGKARKEELVKAKDSQKSVEDKAKAFDEEVKAYVTEHQVSEEDARKDLASVSKIVENAKNDPKKIGKSYLHLQRVLARTTEELKAVKNAASQFRAVEVTADSVSKAIEAGQITVQGKKVSKEQLLESYREAHKDITEDMEDEKVFKLVVKDMKAGVDSRNQKELAQMGTKAKERKAELINALSEADKKLLPQIQPILDKFTDRQILNKNFSLEDTILWSKGKSYDNGVKEAEERGFKRGIEARKIVGQIKKPAEGKPKTKSSGGGTSLTDAEKRAAEEMFSNNDIPIETKYKHYREILDHDKELSERNKKK